MPLSFSEAVNRLTQARKTASARGSVSEYQSDRGIDAIVHHLLSSDNIVMTCCAELDNLMDRGLARYAQPHQLTNGRILTEIDTEYYFVFGDDRPSFVGINYCPFCGRALSRGLWNLEKKKQGM